MYNLLSITDEQPFSREKAIRDMLVRNASKIDQYSIRGLAGSLRIPLPWINEAQVSIS